MNTSPETEPVNALLSADFSLVEGTALREYPNVAQITPVSGAWESLKLLGGITDDGESFYLPCEDNFTGDLTVRLLDALKTEFGEKLCVVLDNAPYFAANNVQEFAEDTSLELCYLPRGSPELNPAEECWHQLSQRLGNQLFEELDELRDAALATLDSTEPPNLFTYLCP